MNEKSPALAGLFASSAKLLLSWSLWSHRRLWVVRHWHTWSVWHCWLTLWSSAVRHLAIWVAITTVVVVVEHVLHFFEVETWVERLVRVTVVWVVPTLWLVVLAVVVPER